VLAERLLRGGSRRRRRLRRRLLQRLQEVVRLEEETCATRTGCGFSSEQGRQKTSKFVITAKHGEIIPARRIKIKKHVKKDRNNKRTHRNLMTGARKLRECYTEPFQILQTLKIEIEYGRIARSAEKVVHGSLHPPLLLS